MLELGGNVIGFSEASSTSASKGESIADTVRVISCYADIIAMRHPKEGAPYVASRNASIPVINAGDGSHCHPTQTLADLCTIAREKGRLDHLTVGFCGDLKYGRTVHSLIAALSRYEGIRIVLISPEELRLPSHIMTDVIYRNEMEYVVTGSLEESIPELDILYMTRVQGERFADQTEYLRLRDRYILTPDKLTSAKPDLAILHPLPRVNEISVKIDDDPRACYFKQVKNGKFMRMALILKLLEEAEKDPARKTVAYSEENGYLVDRVHCHNNRCISTTEQELPQVFRITNAEKRECRCIYCEKKAEY